MCCIDTWIALFRWIQALQVLTQMLVAESRLSKAVFDSPYAEAAFDEIVSKQAIDLTKFGQAILQSKRCSDKVVLAPPTQPSALVFIYGLYVMPSVCNQDLSSSLFYAPLQGVPNSTAQHQQSTLMKKSNTAV